MKREQIVSYFFLGFFLFVLYQIILIFSPFSVAISWAGILAFAFYPVHERIQQIPRLPRTASAILTTGLVVLIVVIPAGFALVSLMQEAIDLFGLVSGYISAGNLELLIEKIKIHLKGEWTAQFWPIWNTIQQDVTDWVLATAKNVGNYSALQLAHFTKNVIVVVTNLFLITFLLFFFFRDGRSIYHYIYRIIPMTKKNKNMVLTRVNETFSAVIRGQVLTCIVQGTLAGLTFWVLGLPVPFLIGFLTFIAAMIPVTGAATIWVPFAIYLLLTNQITKATILITVGVLVISLSDNFLKPLLIGEKANLPIFVLFLCILGGIRLYGFTGIFLGPVLMALFFALTQIYREEYHSEP